MCSVSYTHLLSGTIQNMIGDEILHTERTTPESFELQKLFADMRDAGCTPVIMEAVSYTHLDVYKRQPLSLAGEPSNMEIYNQFTI